MVVNVIFYEDSDGKNCDILGVFRYKKDAYRWLTQNHEWYFDSSNCYWRNINKRGFAEILEKELQ